MADEQNDLRQAQEQLKILYDQLLRTAAKDEQVIGDTVKRMALSVEKISPSSSFYEDAEALRHFGMFAPALFALLVAIGGNDNAKTQSALERLLIEIESVSGNETAKWLRQPSKELNGMRADVRRKTETLIGNVMDKLRFKASYAAELKLIEWLENRASFAMLENRKKTLLELLEKYRVSIRFREVQIEKKAKENETLIQLERARDLLEASPDSAELQALHAKAQKDYNSARAVVANELNKARDSLAIAQRSGNWDEAREQANQILLYRDNDIEAQAAKAQADAYQENIKRAKEQETAILQMISAGKIIEAFQSLKKILENIPVVSTDERINALYTLKDTLTYFQVQWQDLLSYTEQSAFDLAAAKAKSLLDDSQNPLPQSIRELLEKKIHEWKSGQKELQDAEKADQAALTALRAELTQATDWNSLYVIRQKMLVLEPQTPSGVDELDKFQVQVEEALDNALAQEVKQITAKAPRNFDAAARMIVELESLFPDSQTSSETPSNENEEVKQARRFFTQAGRDLHQIVIEDVRHNLENYQATTNEWLEEAQRSLKNGYLAQALKFAQRAEKTGRAPKARDVIRDIRIQQDMLDIIRQQAAANIEEARKKLESFQQQHEHHNDANRLAKELDFLSVDEKWRQALIERNAQSQKEVVDSALLLASNTSDRDAWRKRREEVLKREELYINAQHLRRQGDLKGAVNCLNEIKSFDTRAGDQIEDINALITEMNEASQAFRDEKYSLAIQLFENIKKQTTLSEGYQKELNRAYFETYRKEAEDAIQLYALEDAVRHYEQASRYAPTQTSAKQIHKELDKNRILLHEIQDWQKKVKSYLDQGNEFELKGNLDAAQSRYSDAFALKLSTIANDYASKLYPALRNDLVEASKRVGDLIPLKGKIAAMDGRKDTDLQEQVSMYKAYLQLSITPIKEYQERLNELETSLQNRNRLRSEFEIIRTKLDSPDVQQLKEAFDRITQLEKPVIESGDPYLDEEYKKLSRDAYTSRAGFFQYQGLVDQAKNLLIQGEYQPALDTLQRAEAQKKTPEVEGLINQVQSAITRQLAIADQFQLVESRIQEGDWKGANEILIQIAAAGPSDSDQKARLEILRQRVTEEIEKADALRRHIETINGLLKHFDYVEADKQLSIAKERFGNRLEFVELEREIERVRQICIRLKDVLVRANEAFERNKLSESDRLYREVQDIENAEEIIRIKGWQTLRTDSTESGQQPGGFLGGLKKFIGLN